MLRPRPARGITLIETLIGLTLLALLLVRAAPSMTDYLQNTRIRVAAEAVAEQVRYARAEAIARNTPLRFSLVDTLDATCTPSASGGNWVVSGLDPSGKCDWTPVVAFVPPAPPNVNPGAPPPPPPPVDPWILRKGGATGEGWDGATLTASAAGATAASSITFNGLGQQAAGGIRSIRVSNPGGLCMNADPPGKLRCLDVMLSVAGEARVCDPTLTDANDSRYCAAY